jgi:hypothetical protein
MQGNEVGLVGQKPRRKRSGQFSRLKDFVEEISVRTSNTGIDHCIKDHMVNLQFRFSEYFAVINTNGSQIHSMLVYPRIMTFLLKKKTILTLYLILL